MNNDKAREFFSAYYEGSLDHGLRQTIEQQLRGDQVLASDYAAFTETMKELDSTRYEEIEVPQYLSDRIATRIEHHGQARRGAGAWGWLRGLALAGTATATVAIALVSMNQAGPSDTSVGGIAGGPAVNSDQLNFTFSDGKVVLAYRPSGAKILVVRAGTDGPEVKRYSLSGKSLETTLENPNPSATLFTIEVLDERNRAVLALPGTSRHTQPVGTGSLAEMAKALSGYYQVPVLVQSADVTLQTSWAFETLDARSAASKAVEGLAVGVDQRPSGMIVIL